MQLNSCSQGCVQVCCYLLWLQGDFPGTRGHLGRAWALHAKGTAELSHCHQLCAICYWPPACALQALATKNRMGGRTSAVGRQNVIK